MIKRLLLFVFITAISAIALVACLPAPPSNENGGLQNGDEESKGGAVFTIVYSASDSKDTEISKAKNSIGLKYQIYSTPVSDSVPKADNAFEIILGDTSRALTAVAKQKLPSDIPAGISVFAVVTDGSDTAIVGSSSEAVAMGARWLTSSVEKTKLAELREEVRFFSESDYLSVGHQALTYEIDALQSTPILLGVSLDSIPYESFVSSTDSYNLLLRRVDSLPHISATVPDGMSASVVQPTEQTMTATVTVRSIDGTQIKAYTLKFTQNEYDNMNASIEKAFGGAEATVVIVHDDGNHSTAEYMVEKFTEHGLVGTLGLITKNLANKNDDGSWALKTAEVEYWRNVLSSGVFDVASHSHTHSFWGLSDEAESGWYLDSANNLHEYSFEAGRITEEVAGSREILRLAFPDEDVLAFIKPGFGRVSDENGTKGMTQISKRAYEIIAENYIGMRNTGGDVDGMPIADIYNVKSHTVKDTDTAESWMALVNTAAEQNGLLVFLYHKIEESPSSSLTAKKGETDEFFSALGEEVESGRIWNTHLEDAMRYSAELSASTLDVRHYGDRITLELTDTLDNEIYDQALTVRVPVREGYTKVITDNGQTLEVTDGYVLINVVPDSGIITLTETN